MQAVAIGVVAGVGPWAGLDLMHKLLSEADADCDQAYPTIVSISQPAAIADRTAFLRGDTTTNPAFALAEQVLRLEQMGATVAGIPCNTAHAPAIFDVIQAELAAARSHICLLHMVEEVGAYVGTMLPSVQRVGLLATVGTYASRVYETALNSAELTIVTPSTTHQSAIHDAIYNPVDGIKATGRGTEPVMATLNAVAVALREMGAEALILGCTELPLAITTPTFTDLPIIDPTLILARALLREISTTE